MSSDMKKIVSPFNAAAAACFFLLIAYLAAASFPQYRVWGLNLWAYFPESVPWALFGGGVLVIVGLFLLGHRYCEHEDETARGMSGAVCWIITGGLVATLTLLFYLWRARTHFLGDGYTVLALLADPEPLVKTREIGEAMLHIWVKQLFGQGEPAALKSFQSISIGAGVAYLVSLVMFARALFEQNRDRTLFFLGLASCGYLYNFFGYVENYSVFVVMVSLYCLTGLLVARGRAPRWSVLPMVGLAVLFHIFGVALIPSAVYLLTADTRWSRRVGQWSTGTRWLLAAVLSAVMMAVFLHFYYNYFYFRFAIVPLLPDRFTVEGYHLFSLPHLIDFGNMLLLLVPSLPIAFALLFFSPLKKLVRRHEYRYLLLVVVSCCGAVFIFDPKLGMPRDWDLFSFVGPPLAMTCFYFVLDAKVRSRRYVAIALMMAALGFLMLFPRAISQTSPDLSVTWFNNYAALDKTRNMIGRTLLKKFYDKRGDAEASDREYQRYVTNYPEFTLNRQGLALKKEGKCVEAIALFRKAIDLHPTFVAPYANMGMCYHQLGQFDSALAMLHIAAGMNPHNPIVHNSLARTYYERGDYAEAEVALKRAHRMSPAKMEPLVGLVQLYKRTNHLDNWLKYLNLLVAHENAPLIALTELAEYHLSHSRLAEASVLYRRAIPLGLDSAYLAVLRREFPQLGL